LELRQVAKLSFYRETRTLDEDTRRIFHDLSKGGSEQVGVLNARKVEDAEDLTQRGFVRILYRTKPEGAVQEGYVLCDLGSSSLVGRRFEAKVSAFKDAPHELMEQQGYLRGMSFFG
jgi:hypothetical protein